MISLTDVAVGAVVFEVVRNNTAAIVEFLRTEAKKAITAAVGFLHTK